MLPTERLDYSAIAERPRLALPGGARLAVWVIVNVEEWDINEHDAAHRADPAGRRRRRCPTSRTGPGMNTATGSASGACWRCSTICAFPPCWRSTARRSPRYEPIVRAARERNWEFIGHGFCQKNMQKVADERADIRSTSAAIREATGKNPRGWLGPGLTETWETPDLLAEEGYDYVCDWVLDDQPVVLKTRGKPIVNIPYTQECNDVAMMLIQHHKASEYRDRASTSSTSSTPMRGIRRPRHGAGRAPLHHGRAAPAQICPRRAGACRGHDGVVSGPASRSSTGIWGSNRHSPARHSRSAARAISGEPAALLRSSQ